MKKFILIQLIIIFLGLLTSILCIKSTSNIGILNNSANINDISKIDAKLVFCEEQDNISSYFTSTEDFFEQIDDYYQSMGESLNVEKVILVASVNDQYSIYNDMTKEYITVEDVIEGDLNLIGKTIEIYSDSREFYYEDKETFKRRTEYICNQYPQDEYPEYYIRQPQYRKVLNFLQPNNRYLIFLDKITISGVDYYSHSYFPYSYFNISSDFSIPVLEGEYGLYSSYYNNEIFAINQSYIDSYINFKKQIFNYYKISNQ